MGDTDASDVEVKVPKNIEWKAIAPYILAGAVFLFAVIVMIKYSTNQREYFDDTNHIYQDGMVLNQGAVAKGNTRTIIQFWDRIGNWKGWQYATAPSVTN